MEHGADIRLRLSAQRALLGAVTPRLRSFSIDLSAGVIQTLAVFETEPNDGERDLIQAVVTEVIADFTDETLDEQIVASAAKPPPRLRIVAFERFEP